MSETLKRPTRRESKSFADKPAGQAGTLVIVAARDSAFAGCRGRVVARSEANRRICLVVFEECPHRGEVPFFADELLVVGRGSRVQGGGLQWEN